MFFTSQIAVTSKLAAGITPPRCERMGRVPILVEFDGEPFRIVACEDGTLLTHSTICPHWLGPLDGGAPQNGILRCLWHGYRFDVRTARAPTGAAIGCRRRRGLRSIR
jgi:nitrite reductase/ring-hydroxylating ferredoxin subunit